MKLLLHLAAGALRFSVLSCLPLIDPLISAAHLIVFHSSFGPALCLLAGVTGN
jgi:hypothetical protein